MSYQTKKNRCNCENHLRSLEKGDTWEWFECMICGRHVCVLNVGAPWARPGAEAVTPREPEKGKLPVRLDEPE